jgi:hypothetical protein
MNDKEPLDIGNYCVSFIDLLGQRLEYENEGLLPKFKSNEEKERFIGKFQNTIGRIDALQRSSKRLLDAVLSYKSLGREKLQQELKSIYDEMKEVRLKQQRWSDGLVYFVSLMEGDVKCPMAGVYTLLGATGSLCFTGLAVKIPLRGAIDIAWATELHEGELYGAAVAKAYELESKVAHYPRIVVGPRVVDYLLTNIKNPDSDIYSECNRAFAKLCYDMLARDCDGYHFVHYLGEGFYKTISKELHLELYQNSMTFILEQCRKWGDERNTKLSLRYNHLLSYFLAYPPPESRQENIQPVVDQGLHPSNTIHLWGGQDT